tara:strand:- start:329 stop:466 length:138 start_codon:yes stop_codon:yes gene_type:complete
MLNENVRQFNISVGQKIKIRRQELKKTQTWLAKKNRSNFSASAKI